LAVVLLLILSGGLMALAAVAQSAPEPATGAQAAPNASADPEGSKVDSPAVVSPESAATAGPRAAFEGDVTTFDAQVLLDRAGFSCGYADGAAGPNTRGALRAYQQARGLEATGALDAQTVQELRGEAMATVVEHTLTEEDVAGPYLDKIPEETAEKAKLAALSYSSVLEGLAERWHVTEGKLSEMNPAAAWTAGSVIRVPAVERPPAEARSAPTATQEEDSSAVAESTKVARVVISESGPWLRVENAAGDILFYAPITAGSPNYPLPRGLLKVTDRVADPTFSFDPALLDGHQDDGEKLQLPAGPNNPVGVVWIGLSKEHYGIHGTDEPSSIGGQASSGCVRLTNWDAQRLLGLVAEGTPVEFRD
jgi:lipoprotein-anchoring transpeptidase ErfK/SrfK